MEDYKILWYILAAIIYFITRSKKKKSAEKSNPSRPGTENNPSPEQSGKSFEDLLREITGEGQPVVPESVEAPVEISEEAKLKRQDEVEVENQKLKDDQRALADDESRHVYEESIKRAERFRKEAVPVESFQEPRLFKGKESEEEPTFADEIRDGLSTNEVRKAIIYSEILNRKY